MKTTIITSRANPLIKEFAKLKNKKYISQFGKVLIEGKRFIDDSVNRNVKVHNIIFTDENLIKNLTQINCEFIQVSEQVFELLSQTKTSQGIIAVVELPKFKFEFPKTNFLVLDNVSDPGNFGTIIRTAVAFGFNTIYTLNGVEFYNDKVMRSTMGTLFDCKIVSITIEQLKLISEKFELICADMNGQEALDFKVKSKIFGIVLGNEANGVDEKVKNCCSSVVGLSMINNVESLNVAVSASILMYILKN